MACERQQSSWTQDPLNMYTLRYSMIGSHVELGSCGNKKKGIQSYDLTSIKARTMAAIQKSWKLETQIKHQDMYNPRVRATKETSAP